ncbi:MAG TPA: peroxiredoxin [Burkholderiales bacterium]|nr:peroxiredoxin [Burkholderiales bacterium]
MLKEGDVAPTFELPDSEMELIKLSDFKGERTVVLYFYPKDDTPGCTMEAIDFSDLAEEFEAKQAIVLGVSMDDCLSHGSFRDKHGLSVELLADVEGDVCRKYGVLQEREVEGQRRVGIVRSTFVIDRAGVIRHALYHVSPRGHASEVLELVKRLAS